MKQFLVFIALLASSIPILACGYSPYGEDIRYSLMKPEYFNYSHFSLFYYNANLWGFDANYYHTNHKTHVDANIIDWHHFTNKKVSIEAIEDFNYKMSLTDIDSKNNNDFIKYLFQNNKKEAIAYLKMAKNCEAVNGLFDEDPWERNTASNTNERQLLLDKIVSITQKENTIYFKRKYAFLSIRLAYYANDLELVKSLFEQNFNVNKKDYLYYWSLFFYNFTKSGAESMLNSANIMANCPEKTRASYYYFHEKFDINQALTQTKNKEEIANIYAFASVQKVDENLSYLKEIHTNNPKSEILGFLLLREINKIEDWVYTPYYTNYTPSTRIIYWGETTDKITTETLRNGSEVDRLYAQEVLDFINSIAINKTENPELWNVAKINLQFITRQYSECLDQINGFERNHKNSKAFEEILKIKALCITANQEDGKAIIKPEIQNTIFKYKNDPRFIFALGRELEFKGNLLDGVALLSLIEADNYNSYDARDVEWQANKIRTSGNLKVFYTYFDYLDFVYSAKDLQSIISQLKPNGLSPFHKLIYSKLLKDKDYLTDLLGTKYIRENQLNNALITYKSIGNKYWFDNYNAWERGKYDANYSFDQNPFYDFKYTESFIEHKEKFIVTKLSITEHLIKFTNLVNNPITKDRDYYYFLLGNCYFNMSDYGNSWMMRRYSSSSYYAQNEENESYIDEFEYRYRIKSVAYYKLAYQHAKTDKFKALCLRMMDYAEKNIVIDSKRVNSEFPEYASDLSACLNLETYFKARR